MLDKDGKTERNPEKENIINTGIPGKDQNKENGQGKEEDDRAGMDAEEGSMNNGTLGANLEKSESV